MDNIKTSNTENEYLIIPNPIYDVVFKYLMDDPESAKIVLSTLINENIKMIHLGPLTHAEKKYKPENISIEDPKTQDDIRLFHLDFTAVVELPDGTEELIMIELQKASEPDDIFRFKRYICKNFQKKQVSEIIHPETQSVKTIDKPIRLIPIFILNFRIENEINDLLINTNRIKTGIFKNKQLQKHNEFIDNLSYDIWVVQLPNLNNIRQEEYESDIYKNKLYTLLKLFDQKSRVKDNEHRLRLIRKFFPGFLDRIIKRLQSADIDNPDLEEQMYAEDEYLQALIDRDNQISYFKEQLDNEKNQSSEKDKIIYDLAKILKETGTPIETIIEKTNLTKQDIEKL